MRRRSLHPVALLSTFALLGTLVSGMAAAPPPARAAGPISFTILHTNDFHGQLVPSGSAPGLARVAGVVNGVRTAKGAGNVLLVDAGDEMQGSLLSNLQKGAPTIAAFNAMQYDVATFGNHEFDWGQQVLADRVAQSTFPHVSANIVAGTCTADNWTSPSWTKPYEIKTVAGVKVAFIGVTTQETPTITVATATQGLCFKDPTASIEHYYAEMTANADVIVVLSHLGYNDGGYGYGIPVYGDQTLAKNLITDGMPVSLIIGGHSHTNLATPGTVVTVTGKASQTTIGQAYYNGRALGEADLTFDPATKAVTVAWQKIPVNAVGALSAAAGAADTSISVAEATTPPTTPFDITVDDETMTVTARTGPTGGPFTYQVTRTSGVAHAKGATVALLPVDTAVKSLITTYANDAAYLALVNQPVGYSAVDLPRNSGTVDNMMGTFVDDAIYNYLNTDTDPTNDIDVFFNNAGGIRTDWCYVGGAWVNTGCTAGTHDPALLTYGNMFTILPFGNATVVGKMTGAQILEVLNKGPQVSNGVIQPAGLKYKYYSYKDANPGPQPYAWGAFDYCIVNKTTQACDPIDLTKTYSVGTNEFLAPAGGDGYSAFKYMTNITYWGDMLNAVDAYVSAHYGTTETAYRGPNGDGTLDERITRDGTDAAGSGSIVPITILHNNDSHGNLAKGAYVGYTQLATLIKQERAHNPTRTLLLNGGDQIQGDSMMYYFKSAPSGFAADGTPLPDALKTHPMMAVMNSLAYDAMVLGNHEFNFGSDIFKGVMGQAQFPILGANVSDDGRYGLAAADGGQGVKPFIEKDLGGVKVAVVGITNHRVPNYELPSNIVGLTFSDPLAAAQVQNAAARARGDDVVIDLTHIGFTENPKSVEVDKNVDTNLAALGGMDAIIGSHSHTDPSKQTDQSGAYKFLPTIVGGANNAPVIVTQAYRYNNYLGEVVLGVRPKAGGGYEVVSRAGQYLSVVNSPTATPEDPGTKAIVAPYVAQINLYNNKVVGQTTAPIDTLKAFTEETNGANLQADASVWELAQHGITDVDIHLSGAMTNKLMASGATEASPVTLKISDMFGGMPYENSLVTLRMNGPQLKAVLERAYRNYYYYKYVPGYGGYSYYTTCMLDTNSVGRIYYRDTSPSLPDGNNVVALMIGGKPVDFSDAAKYYKVSTVNYLAAGSCNFNDNGVSLWPLNQIVNDTQYYVRDAVIDYINAMTTVSPKVEGRLLFGDTVAPVATINAPAAQSYLHPDFLTLDFSAVDGSNGTTPSLAPPSGVKSIVATLDGAAVETGQKVDLYTLQFGNHTLNVSATDYYGNAATQSVTFQVIATVQSLKASVNRFYAEGSITKATLRDSLLGQLNLAQAYLDQGNTKAAINQLNAFINLVKAQSGKGIKATAASLLVTDAQYVIKNPK